MGASFVLVMLEERTSSIPGPWMPAHADSLRKKKDLPADLPEAQTFFEEVRNRQRQRHRGQGLKTACGGLLLGSSWRGGILLRFSNTTDVARMTARRNDEDWTRDLASEDAALRDNAVGDLRDMLYRGLAKSLSKQWSRGRRVSGRHRAGSVA